MALNLIAQFNNNNNNNNNNNSGAFVPAVFAAWAAGYETDDSVGSATMSQADTVIVQDHSYRDKTTLLHWERREFDERYTVHAVSTLRVALRILVCRWREYRARRMDRHIAVFTYANRFLEYQQRSYHQLVMQADGSRETNVFERICEVDKYLMRRVPNFERQLLRYIAMFLLPSADQHRVYYGYAGKSLGAAIDVTFEQPKIDGKVPSKLEWKHHNNEMMFMNAADLEDGWDYDSAAEPGYAPEFGEIEV